MVEQVSLRRRLTWYLIAIMLVLTATSGVLVYQGTMHEADEVFSASLVQTARILDGLISRAALAANREQLELALERRPSAHKYERRLFFAVLDADGDTLLQSRGAPQIPDALSARDSARQGFSEFRHEQRTWLTFALPASRDDLFIIVGERSKAREEISEYIGGGLLLPLLLLLPAGVWLLWQIVGIALKPLQAVTDQLQQQDIRRLQAINVSGVPREIGPLVAALNRMIADLDAAYLRERRFVGDASHELRNPLASLLINVDNANEECRDAEAIESLQAMKISIKRLSHLVAQLLELSRFENPRANREFRRLDLRQVIESAAAGFRQQADDKEIDIELQMPAAACEVMAVDTLLYSMVSNLIDNAIKYCDRGCRIRLGCRLASTGPILAVEDSGPGLDAEQRARATGRFYRAGDTNRPGAGLGLAIVESIAEIHAASVELAVSELGGLAVRVRFDSSGQG